MCLFLGSSQQVAKDLHTLFLSIQDEIYCDISNIPNWGASLYTITSFLVILFHLINVMLHS